MPIDDQDPETICSRWYVGNGVRLEIVAERITTNEWALAVINEHGIMSHWNEFFATSEAALNAGLRAIETEGTDEFTSTEGFDYL